MAALVSVVVPAYQAAAHLGEALASLRAQDWPSLEIIVVDDGSTDATPQIAARVPGVTLLRQHNQGAGAARDAGIAASRGAYVLLADADDRADPGLVRALVREMEATGADLTYARCRYVDEKGHVMAVQRRQTTRPGPVEVLAGFMVNSPLVRRSAILEIGGHDPALKGSIDLDLRVRLALRRPGAIAAVDAVLSDYRRGHDQITSDWRRMRSSWFAVRDKAVASGLSLTKRAERDMRGRHCVYWATLAYMAGDFAAARRLMVEAARLVPSHVALDPDARLRAASCLASLLPAEVHGRIRTRFNARRRVRS